MQFSSAIKLISSILEREIKANDIPGQWLKNVSVTFQFDTEYKHKCHFWGSGLGGKPCMCIVKITTDLDKIYSKEFGCTVWVHNPKREQRRYDF
ncbi:hypothetical protein [Pseudoalteromonas sp. MMG005]|uniref:hypothetical protein n=1 Tax=Pseudoalteromonas sp. MMG005 TaxID=2822682 RepID=UPI001B3A0891|nr:hypothetical protein [Pseudoalteromonas sp. MMG005]